MINLQPFCDKFSISLSVLCTLHCLLLPTLVVMLPSLATLNLGNEIFHIWMVVAVIPISGFALTLGCKHHKNYRITLFGVIGIVILVLSAILDHHLLTENIEKTFTVVGALIIMFAHLRNYQLRAESRLKN